MDFDKPKVYGDTFISDGLVFPFSKLSFCVVAILLSKLFAFCYFCLLVGTVEKREADLSMNLALTGAREKVVDYSVAYIGW